MMDPYVIFAFGMIFGVSLSIVAVYIYIRMFITYQNCGRPFR